MNTLDDRSSLIAHKKIIQTSGILKQIYQDIYKTFARESFPKGLIVEIGSGGGFIKTYLPEVITSDVISGPGIDQVFSVEKMPYKDKSIAGFVMLNVFHHFKHPQVALKEISRCLKPQGKIIMIEPYNSIWGRFVYQHFHHETFDPSADWHILGRGRMSDANGAMPWIVFKRDRSIFNNKFPELKINSISVHTPLVYIVSGGLSHRQFLPSFTYPALKFIEKSLSPLAEYLGMFTTITLLKK